jgi:O-antigen ligase
MAIPLTLGYIVARVRAREQRHRNAVDIAPALDAPMVWLAAAACLMVGALFVSLSRSGALGLMAGAGTLLWVSRQRMDRRGRRWLLAGIASVLIVASAYLSAHGFALRLDQTAREGLGSRAMIWNETWPMLRDFWLTGVGFGGYGRGMLVYQQTTREIFFNHAHNGYLQLAVEGGVLVGVPAVIAIVAGVWQLARRLRADHSPMFWIRAGAFSGLVAIAVQSIWEVGLVLPANAVLFAVLAAIAVHEP